MGNGDTSDTLDGFDTCPDGAWESGEAVLTRGQRGSKVIMVITAEGKVIMRLPSTGGKVIKCDMPRWGTTGA